MHWYSWQNVLLSVGWLCKVNHFLWALNFTWAADHSPRVVRENVKLSSLFVYVCIWIHLLVERHNLQVCPHVKRWKFGNFGITWKICKKENAPRVRRWHVKFKLKIDHFLTLGWVFTTAKILTKCASSFWDWVSHSKDFSNILANVSLTFLYFNFKKNVISSLQFCVKIQNHSPCSFQWKKEKIFPYSSRQHKH